MTIATTTIDEELAELEAKRAVICKEIERLGNQVSKLYDAISLLKDKIFERELAKTDEDNWPLLLKEQGSVVALRALEKALGAAQFDINNRLGADQFNATQGLAANQNQRANLGFLADLGATERSIASENNPNVAALSQSQALAQLLASLNPALYTGQTSNTNGTTTAQNKTGFLESLGTLAMGAGALGYNPFRVGK